jgi:hypothetical protein
VFRATQSSHSKIRPAKNPRIFEKKVEKKSLSSMFDSLPPSVPGNDASSGAAGDKGGGGKGGASGQTLHDQASHKPLSRANSMKSEATPTPSGSLSRANTPHNKEKSSDTSLGNPSESKAGGGRGGRLLLSAVFCADPTAPEPSPPRAAEWKVSRTHTPPTG